MTGYLKTLTKTTGNNFKVQNKCTENTDKAIFTVSDNLDRMIRCYIECGEENVKESEEFLQHNINDWPE